MPCIHFPFWISTHTSLAGGDVCVATVGCQKNAISTHTSLAGGDKFYEHLGCGTAISTHTSLAGGDPKSG